MAHHTLEQPVPARRPRAGGLLATLAIAAVVVGPTRADDVVREQPQAGAASDGARLLEEVQRRMAQVRTATASFTQSYRSAALGQEVVERGRLVIKRPGRMRWDYRQPDRKVFVVAPDGTTLSYVPSDYAAVRGRIPAEAPHLQLLLGDVDLLGSFDVTEVKLKNPLDPSARVLKLKPRSTLQSVEMVYVEIDPQLLGIQRVLIVDPLGNESDLVLDKVRENAGVRDDAFDVRLPAGIEIRQSAPSGGSR